VATKDISDRQVLEAFVKYHKARDVASIHTPVKWPYEILMEETGECFKVCYAAMQRAPNRDLIDYGVSLRTAWLTEKGLEKLNENVTL